MTVTKAGERILILAPLGQDAAAMAILLERHGFRPAVCGDPAEACGQMAGGAGALLLTEEALELPQIPDLLEAFRAQPAWSELPLIILTSGGESRLSKLLDLTAMAARSVSLLERPLGAATLVRSVEVALHSRRRQYQVRDLIEEQQRKEQQLRESEQLLRRAKEFDEAVMNNMGEGLYTVDDHGLVTFMNPAAEKLFGWTLDELRGRKMHDVTHYKYPDGSPFPAEECAGLQVLRRGTTLADHEDVFIRKDGTFFPVIYSSSPIREGERITGVAVVFRDITERKHAEESLARRASEQAALYAFTDKLHRAGSLNEIYNSALDSILTALSCKRASILLFDNSGVMQFVAWRGLSDAYRQAVEGHSPWTADALDPQPIGLSDVEGADISQSLKDVVRGEGIRALAFIPVVTGGKLIGKFMTYYNAPHEFTAEELDLALTIARQLGVAVERKQAEEKLRKSEAQLETELADTKLLQRISAEMVQEENVERLYEQIMDTATAIMRSDFASMQELYPDRGEHGELLLLAHRGFSPESAETWKWVRTDTGCVCGEALRTGRRALAPDVETCEFMSARCLEIYRQMGVRAVQSTPLVSRRGRIVGMISTHWRDRHEPSQRELRLMDILGRQAADLIERKKAEQIVRESEERFRTLVAQVRDYAIFRMDNEGRPTSWNEGVRRVLGFEEAEFIGQNIATIIFTPEDVQAGIVEQELREATEKGTASNDRWMRRKDGTRFFATGVTTSLRNEAGQHVGYTKVLRDETPAKQAEEAKARLAAIIESSDDAIVSKDLNGVITSWNLGAERLFGYTAQEAIGQSVTLVIPLDRLNEEPAILERIRHGERIDHFDTVRRRKDGELRDISLVISPIRDTHGRIVGASKIARDITERKQAEKALAEAQKQLQGHAANLERTVAERTHDLLATNEQLEAFVYSIAHDLRAPLRSMGGFSQLLVEDYAPKLDDTAQHLLKRIQSSSEFMDKLLMDLLAYGRTARSEMELSSVDVRIAWETAIFQCSTQIEQSEAMVETIEPLPKVFAHEATLGQCLANLLGNALKFVAPGVKPHVRFWAEPRENYVRLWVQDNGLGIPAEQQERAFRVFERLHGSRFQGTGIGLSIVRKGVERMGGEVGLESEPGKGSKFWIELAKTNSE